MCIYSSKQGSLATITMAMEVKTPLSNDLHNTNLKFLRHSHHCCGHFSQAS